MVLLITSEGVEASGTPGPPSTEATPRLVVEKAVGQMMRNAMQQASLPSASEEDLRVRALQAEKDDPDVTVLHVAETKQPSMFASLFPPLHSPVPPYPSVL